jgi:CheY-like chemotaxis protein
MLLISIDRPSTAPSRPGRGEFMKRTIAYDEQNIDAMHAPAVLRPLARDGSPVTVVVAEDDAATRMLICRILTRASFVVHAVENGALACEVVRRTKPHVVLLDWVMPVMDGCRVVKVLKGDVDTREIPIVMLSTQSRLKDRIFALETGVADFMPKPFAASDLIACVKLQLHLRDVLDAPAAFRF